MRNNKTEQQELDEAEEIKDYTGWVFLTGYGKDGFSPSAAEMNDEIEEGGPEFAFACTSEPPQSVWYDDIIENAFVDSFEEASEHVGAAEAAAFQAACVAFNEHIAKILTWTPDYKHKVRLQGKP